MQWLLNTIVKQLERTFITTGWLEALVGRYSKVGNQPFFAIEQFPWAQTLEANWKTIRQELDAVLEQVQALPNYQDISPRQATITSDNQWKTYFFYAFGYKAQQNCDRCPQTTQLLEQIPGLKVAFFSILGPQKHIPEHRGKHKGLIRYHLALKVPEPTSACRLRVADKIVSWQEGKSLIFDDTFLHEVWNGTDDYRVVLFLDVARPLYFPLSLLNGLINTLVAASPIVQEAKVNHENWESTLQNSDAKTARSSAIGVAP